MDAERINHLDLLREVVAVRTLVDRLVTDMAELRSQLGDPENGIYARLNRLEQSRAQLILMAIISGLVLPVLVTIGMDRALPRIESHPAAAVSP
ncbi:MAG: hypothetical protein EBR82_41430 [Caulobacteraceae bacterium]|nr:hypothetical protein [Caulobacteraceae bacterium]